MKGLKATRLLRISGALTATASLATLAVSFIYLSAAMQSAVYPRMVAGVNLYYVYYLAVGIFGVVSFLFGLPSAFFILKHRRGVFSWLGLALLTASGALMSYPLFFFGLPILALSMPAMVLVVLSSRS
jgi:hypothetical protein